MNKKGQALVLFIVFLPIVVFGLGFTIDYLNFTVEETKTKNLTKQVIKELAQGKINQEEVKNIYEKNNYNPDDFDITEGETIIIKGKYSYDNIFNLLFNEYNIQVYYEAHNENDEVIIKEGE